MFSVTASVTFDTALRIVPATTVLSARAALNVAYSPVIPTVRISLGLPFGTKIGEPTHTLAASRDPGAKVGIIAVSKARQSVPTFYCETSWC